MQRVYRRLAGVAAGPNRVRSRRTGVLCAGVLCVVLTGGRLRLTLLLFLLRVGCRALRLTLLLRFAGLVVRDVRRGSRHSFKGTVPRGVGLAALLAVRLPRPACWSASLFASPRATERTPEASAHSSG